MNTWLFRLTRLAALSALCVLATRPAIAKPAANFTLVGIKSVTLTSGALAIAVNKSVPLVIVTGPSDDMLSYRIGGRRNPTLRFQKAATIKILFVNADDDMFHNIRFGAVQTHYPNSMDSVLKSSVGTPPLPHKSGTVYHAAVLTLLAPNQPGTYAYFCTVRGHAQGGMSGNITVH